MATVDHALQALQLGNLDLGHIAEDQLQLVQHNKSVGQLLFQSVEAARGSIQIAGQLNSQLA